MSVREESHMPHQSQKSGERVKRRKSYSHWSASNKGNRDTERHWLEFPCVLHILKHTSNAHQIPANFGGRVNGSFIGTGHNGIMSKILGRNIRSTGRLNVFRKQITGGIGNAMSSRDAK